MREEKTFRLGTVVIREGIIDFVPEDSTAFEASRHEAVRVGVQYRYHEATEDKETAHVRLHAGIDGHAHAHDEALIEDHPVANDSRRGFLSVPVRIGAAGELRGRFTVEARYESGPWKGEADRKERALAEGEFRIRVR